MPRAFTLLLLALALPGPATAGIYRCRGEDGGVRYVDSPHACRSGAARSVEPRTSIQTSPPAAPPASTDTSGAEPGSVAGALDALLPAALPGWEVVNEAPESLDADLRRWGVAAKRARHYTRSPGGASQVCSVELWQFRDEQRAKAALAGFAYPDWQISRAGPVLVMLRGVTLARGQPPVRGVFPACEQLGARVRARVTGS